MSQPAPRPRSGLLALLTCLVAIFSWAGAITGEALLTYLLPSAAAVGLVGLLLRGPVVLRLLVVMLLGLGAAVVVNLLSGELQGPAARGTALVAAGTGVAVVLIRTQAPALFLLPVAGIIVAADGYGAGGQVQAVSLATGALCLLALAVREPERRGVTAGRSLLSGATALTALVLVAGGYGAVLVQADHNERESLTPLRVTILSGLEGPEALKIADNVTAKREAPEAVTAEASSSGLVVAVPESERRWLSWLLWLVLLVLGVVVLAVLVRFAYAWWSWRRRLRAILRKGPSVGTIWVWTTAHLARAGQTIPVHQSPDVLAAGAAHQLPRHLRKPVGDLASVVAQAVYGPPDAGRQGDLKETWRMARATARTAWDAAGTRRRLRARWTV